MGKKIAEEWLDETWDNFLTGFCKVNIVCFEGEPNWLGYILLPIFFLIVFYLSLFLFEISLISVHHFFHYKPFGENRRTLIEYLGIMLYFIILLFLIKSLFF
jgi:hypothetical protein